MQTEQHRPSPDADEADAGPGEATEKRMPDLVYQDAEDQADEQTDWQCEERGSQLRVGEDVAEFLHQADVPPAMARRKWLTRRHHCRRCGGIFCTSHSARAIPLDQEARFHPDGGWVRSCDNCWGDFIIWQHDRKSRTSSITSGSTATPPAMMFAPDLQIRCSAILGIKHPEQKPNPYGPGNESVGADWNWSTF